MKGKFTRKLAGDALPGRQFAIGGRKVGAKFARIGLLPWLSDLLLERLLSPRLKTNFPYQWLLQGIII